jgi:hypothetical protein
MLRRRNHHHFNTHGRPPCTSRRLRLERLESRATPAVVNWTGAAHDANRLTPSNRDRGLPGSTDPFYLWYLDADNSGAVDAQDVGQLKARFNHNVFGG